MDQSGVCILRLIHLLNYMKNNKKTSILIIEDDEKLSNLLKEYLQKNFFKVERVLHPEEALNKKKWKNHDLILLDLMLPDIDGFEVCNLIRRESQIPIIMTTARGEIPDRVAGLEMGADDYIPKPFEPRELLARIKAILRRIQQKQESNKQDTITIRDITIDKKAHSVIYRKRLLEFTSTEYQILLLLMENAGVVMTRDAMTETLYGDEFDLFNRSIDILITRIRKKLNDSASNPKYIKTIRGSGYLMLE